MLQMHVYSFFGLHLINLDLNILFARWFLAQFLACILRHTLLLFN
jgi:hypothetical protein